MILKYMYDLHINTSVLKLDIFTQKTRKNHPGVIRDTGTHRNMSTKVLLKDPILNMVSGSEITSFLCV